MHNWIDSDVIPQVHGLDATTVLTTYIILLMAIPSPMVVGPLGSAGAPSAIFALGAFLLWLWFQFKGGNESWHRTSPVRIAALAWLFIMLVVYARAMSSPIPYDEISPADNGLIKLVGFVGILLVANDGIVGLDRFRTVARRLVIAAGLVAVLGLIQYATRDLWVDRLSIPGLTHGTSGWELIVRNGHPRPSGTSTHPIEYGVVLTMVMPLAVAFALRSPSRRWLYRLLLALIVMAVFLSISRSAMLCAAVAFVVMLAGWDMATRIRAIAVSALFAAGVYFVVPGVLGTIRSLFTSVSEDPSIASRTGSYDLAFEFIGKSPFLGRGFGTFMPKYWILDNGYLGMFIEGGVFGLLGLVGVICCAAVAAIRSSRLAQYDFDRELAKALLASIAAGASGLAFFDTFGFPQSAGCFFLVLGLSGGMLRFLSTNRSSPGSVDRGDTPVSSVDR